MKRIIEINEEGLEKLLGQRVLLLCSAYLYTGHLVGVNKNFVCLEDPAIVYDTGAFDKAGYTDVQKLHAKKFYIMIASIEAFGISK